MTKKHFKALAAAIKGITDNHERATVSKLVGTVCANDNPRFDWDRWFIACHCG